MEFTDYIALFCFGLMILGGGAMIFFGGRDLWRALASSRWPSVPAVILKSEVSASSSGSGRGASLTYNLSLVAGYQVNGQDYQTGKVYYGASGGSGDASEARVEQLRYPAGAKVAVYHHPKEPAEAVLRPGFDLDVLGVPCGGVALLFGGVAFTLMFLGGFKDYPVLNQGIRALGLVFLTIGVGMLTPGLVRLKHALGSRAWPVAPGAIVYAVETSSTSEIRDSDGSRTSATSFGAPLAYQYTVNGKIHYSNIRCFGALTGASRDWAALILERYPKGAEVPVSYHPADPDLAVLEPGINSEAYWLPGGGAGFLLFGIAVVILSYRARF